MTPIAFTVAKVGCAISVQKATNARKKCSYPWLTPPESESAHTLVVASNRKCVLFMQRVEALLTQTTAPKLEIESEIMRY